MNNKNKLVNIIIIVLGALLALIPFHLAPVCPAMKSGMKMSCHYSGILVASVGAAIVVITLLMMIFKKRIITILASILNIVLSLAVILIPNKLIKIKIGTMKNGMPKYMSYCGKDTMACVTHHTFTYATIIASIIFILTLGFLVYILIKKEKVDEK